MTPALLIAAPSSGSGKTTITCAIAAALRRRGQDLRLFKAGPDYLDPGWHAAVTGRPGRNLDGWMTGHEGVRESFARGAQGGDRALIEGVMGLFDGRAPTSLEGSGAELALLLGIPVVLVVDASAMARTAAAVVEGLARHAPGVEVAGVIFNRVGGEGHARLLEEAMTLVKGVAYLGATPEHAPIALPERHLGLVSARQGVPEGWADRLADLAEKHLHLDRLPWRAPTLPRRPPPPPAPGPRARIGVAQDEAFQFYYPDNLELLEEAGAALVPFSPLHDGRLPEGLDGLYLGGGYPELYVDGLRANSRMRQEIRDFSGVVYAECGGLMYLGERLDGSPMCGALPVSTVMGPGLRSLGYREVTLTRDTVLGPAGTVFRGHEFRHSELVEAPALEPAYAMTGWSGAGVEGWAVGRRLGSYVHAHFGSNPRLAANLVGACRAR